jgi:cupin superfamily acireductone dioxygenase involved in methionine salvage
MNNLFKKQKIDIENEESFSLFLSELKTIYPNNDIFNSIEPITINTHTHNDFETRLFLSGEAEFIINNIKIICNRGDYIEIYSNTPHSFNYYGGEELKVLRFFSNNIPWQANFK